MASAASRKRTGLEFAIDGGKGIVDVVHEDAAHGVDDERAFSRLGVDQGSTPTWIVAHEIHRADQARRALDEDQRLFLIPGVIAERDGVGAGIQQFLIDRLGDAETAGGIFAIDDDEIERPVADHARQISGDGGAAGPADDVTDEENTQTWLLPEIERIFFR